MITPFGLRHIGLVHELQVASTPLDPKSALLVQPASPLRAALRGYLFNPNSGIFTYVLRTADHESAWRGFVQARAHRSGLAWKVTYLAPGLESSEDAATVWYRLLLHLCIAAGERRVQRLIACLPEDSPAEEVFRQASFAVYCHERLFVLPSTVGEHGQPSSAVQRLPLDERWDPQRLVRQTTPRVMLQAEELSDPQADCQPLEALPLDSQQAYGRYTESGELDCLAYMAMGSRGACLRLIVHPDARDGAAELLDHVLAVVNKLPARPLYCPVRDYEGGIEATLDDHGFDLAGTNSLLVKHTTVQVREPRRKLVPALEKRAEIAPTISRSTE
jgi:hypothetical protein